MCLSPPLCSPHYGLSPYSLGTVFLRAKVVLMKSSLLITFAMNLAFGVVSKQLHNEDYLGYSLCYLLELLLFCNLHLGL